MAVTNYGVNNALAVKLWAKTLSVEAIPETYVGRFIGTDANSLLHLKTDLKKSAGDKLTYGLRVQLSGDGVTEGSPLEGNEESLTTYDDSLFINQLRHAVRVASEDTIDAQRVPFDLRMEAKDGLRDWYADRFDTTFFNHICGYTVVTDARYSGNNDITAPSTNRIFRAGSQAADEDLTTSHRFSLDLVDKAVEKAKTAEPLIRPIRVNGKPMYVMFLHPYQVTDLRTNTSAGQWFDIQKAAMTGGKISGNPIFTDALGVYHNVVLHEAQRVTQGVHSSTGAAVSTARRAVLCGAQAGAIGFSRRNPGNLKFKWVEKHFDYENELGVSGKTIWGLKKTVFNSEDFATIVVPTYAAAAA